ncbi:MAG: GTP 3',8-cyclase MoaA [Myxococcales bacterium]|nr:GTP 3',8-cyclase MoaA [Myxococcales bacterium]
MGFSRQRVTLRLSVTDRCQLRCRYCMPLEGVPRVSHHDVLRFEEILRVVTLLRERFGLYKVRLTGGEPLLRSGITELARALASMGEMELALTTNGQLLSDLAEPLRRAGLTRINVSLDSLDPARYRELTRGGSLERTIAGIEAARAAGFAPIKLNTVVLRGVNLCEVGRIATFALERGLQPRFLELMPIGCARGFFERDFVSSEEVHRELEKDFTLAELPVNPASSSREFTIEGSGRLHGMVGFISSESRPFCAGCDRLRLTSTGTLIGCLARGDGCDLRKYLRLGDRDADEELAQAVHQVLAAKRPRGEFTRADLMPLLGG